MGMHDPIPTFSYLVQQLRDRLPNLAYLHIVEPRAFGDTAKAQPLWQGARTPSNDFIRDIWASRTLITAGGFSPESAKEHAEKTGDLIAFGRYFISNVRKKYCAHSLLRD
jgi:NADPH2 dehydrogenase